MESRFSSKPPSISFYDSPKSSLSNDQNKNYYRSLSVTTPPRKQDKVDFVNAMPNILYFTLIDLKNKNKTKRLLKDGTKLT